MDIIMTSVAQQKLDSPDNQFRVNDYGKHGYPGVKTTFGFWDNGYGFYLAENNQDGVTYTEKANFTTFDNVKLLKPHSGSSYDLEVESG